MIRQFIGFDEAAAVLDSDYEGLRQAFELGLAEELPAYVYAGDRPFLARFQGKGVVANAPDLHDSTSATVEIPGYGQVGYFDLWDDRLSDPMGDVNSCDRTQADTGHPFLVELLGYFRVAPYELKPAARQHHVGMVSVAPDSWWKAESPIPKTRSGRPAVLLALTPTNDPHYRDMPELSDLQFRVADVEAVKAARTARPAVAAAASGTKPTRIRADREENLLRVIAGLWVLSGLPDAHNVTADKLSALFDSWGWDGPGKSTIADTILKPAANLPRAKLRTPPH